MSGPSNSPIDARSATAPPPHPNLLPRGERGLGQCVQKTPLPSRERKGPAAKPWEGEGARQNQPTGRTRYLRKTQTEPERRLWKALRARRCEGLKFRRQVSIGRYIVDFICFESRLIIEVDGGQHARRRKYDLNRTAFLRSQDFRVLRFWNNEVRENLRGVLDVIARSATVQPPHPPTASPRAPSSPARGEESFRDAGQISSLLAGEGEAGS